MRGTFYRRARIVVAVVMAAALLAPAYASAACRHWNLNGKWEFWQSNRAKLVVDLSMTSAPERSQVRPSTVGKSKLAAPTFPQHGTGRSTEALTVTNSGLRWFGKRTPTSTARANTPAR
jgi:hypothetical protein